MRALSPYLFLILSLSITRTIPALQDVFRHYFVISLPQYDFTLALLFSPGFYLMLACLYTIISFRLTGVTIAQSMRHSIRQFTPVLLSTLGFVIMSQVMVYANMITLISQSFALFFGSYYLYIAPLIGGLGGFLTGSNTGANAMFIQLQLKTAETLQLSPDLVAWIQNSSSSHLVMTFPARIVLAATIGGIGERENQLLRYIFLIGLGTILLLMCEIYISTHLFYSLEISPS
ncbi:L-lactate permease [Mechercharimyces sp. CAU 1602]|uniref:L-lactate permease n=1 Tax=Mechercharimyces sp. CAU 1602 TaxID=2973933 RepID=UPI0037CADA1F